MGSGACNQCDKDVLKNYIQLHFATFFDCWYHLVILGAALVQVWLYNVWIMIELDEELMARNSIHKFECLSMSSFISYPRIVQGVINHFSTLARLSLHQTIAFRTHSSRFCQMIPEFFVCSSYFWVALEPLASTCCQILCAVGICVCDLWHIWCLV